MSSPQVLQNPSLQDPDRAINLPGWIELRSTTPLIINFDNYSELNPIREEESKQNPDGVQTQFGDKKELQLSNLSSPYTTKGKLTES